MLSMFFNKYRGRVSLGTNIQYTYSTHRLTHSSYTDRHTKTQKQNHRTAFRQAQRQAHAGDRGWKTQGA